MACWRRHDAIFCQGAEVHQVFELAPVAQTRAARAIKLHGERRLAEISLAQDRQLAVAIEAMPAMRIPGQYDMVTDGDATRLSSDPLNDACRLVAEDDRHRIAQGPFDHFEIGVAQAGGLDSDQHVAGGEISGFYRLDRKRRLRRVEHGGLVGECHWKFPATILVRMRRDASRRQAPQAPRRYRPTSSPTHCRSWRRPPS